MVGAELHRDTEVFGSMDPYVKCQYGNKKFKSHTHSDGGKKPKWDYKIEFMVDDINDQIKFNVFDSETFGSDDCIGDLITNINSIIGRDRNYCTNWYELKHKGKHAGQLQLRTTFQWPIQNMMAQGAPHQ